MDSSEATASGNPIIVTFTKSGNAYEIDSKGIIKPSTPRDPSTSNLTATELAAIEANNSANPTDKIEEITSRVTNTNLQDATKIKAVLTGNVPIPVGANYKEGTVDTGVVIEYKSSEFVWVPVNSDLTVKGTTKAMARPSTIEGLTTPDSNGRTNYEGVLYVYDYYDYNDYCMKVYSSSQVMSSYGQGTSGYREPDIVSNYDNNPGSLSTINLTQSEFKTEIQENYNAMIESVSKYGGFFVGRYETSIDPTTTVASKTAIPMNASENSQMWYGMYDKQKKFTTTTDVMQSSMIWGSQYDAMLNWMQAGGKDITITDKGNHSGSPTMTGGTATDIINNIYDLEGNLYEWTLEANGSSTRSARGSSYLVSYPIYNRTSSFYAYYTYNDLGTRLSLYIK